MNISKGRYAILGGSGLVGTSILSFLKDIDGVDVVSTCFTREPIVYADNIEHVKMDLRVRENCRKIIKGVDYVILTASNILLYSMPEDIIVKGITSNLLINVQVLESCYDQQVKKVVWISSTTAYPYKNSGLKEDEIFDSDPMEEYFSIGWMTRFIEKLCIIYAEKLKRKLSLLILRPTCIYGEREGFDLDKCHVLPAMVRRIVDRIEPIEIYGDGKQKRDFIYVDDIARTCINFLSYDKIFDTFNIGTDEYYSVNDIVNIICEELGINDLQIKYVNIDRKIEKDRIISSKKIKNEMNFKPSVNIRQGISKLIKEYKRYG